MKYFLMYIFVIIISCNDTNNITVDKEKNNKVKIKKSPNPINNKSFEKKIKSFIKYYPKKFDSIETYYVSFCTKNNDTIIVIQKGLYTDFFAFINPNIEYKGWFNYHNHFINVIDKKFKPIGISLINYSYLSKNRLENKKIIEYHGQKWLHELMIYKQYKLNKGELKEVNNEKRICLFK